MRHIVIILTLILFPLLSHAEGSIQIAVKLTPAGSFVAKSEKLKGDLIKQGQQITSEKMSVTIDTFKTGMSLRDEHFCKHLGCLTQPKAVISNLKGTAGKGTGMMELNGVKKEITFTYEENANQVTAKMVLNSADFKMPHAQYLGIEVHDTVSVEVKSPLQMK